MLAALVTAGFVLGLAATPHCALMCGAPCAAVTASGGAHTGLFHGGRLLGYSAAGALAASSVATLGAWLQASPALRPLWTLMHLALVLLGLWWLLMGRSPAGLLQRPGAAVNVPLRWHGGQQNIRQNIQQNGQPSGQQSGRPSGQQSGRPSGQQSGQQRTQSKNLQALGSLRSGAVGLAWVAWPCAALQGALLLAAVADGAVGGALVMAAFALASLPGLLLAPWAWARVQSWQVRRGQATAPGEVAALGFRLAGLGLLLVSGWALTHTLWQRAAAWCGL
jgi:uncharacterized protein